MKLKCILKLCLYIQIYPFRVYNLLMFSVQELCNNSKQSI